jgi:hypothetical protein
MNSQQTFLTFGREQKQFDLAGLKQNLFLFLLKGLAHNMLIDSINPLTRKKGETDMNIFYIVGVVVVVMFVAGFFGLR